MLEGQVRSWRLPVRTVENRVPDCPSRQISFCRRIPLPEAEPRESAFVRKDVLAWADRAPLLHRNSDTVWVTAWTNQVIPRGLKIRILSREFKPRWFRVYSLSSYDWCATKVHAAGAASPTYS